MGGWYPSRGGAPVGLNGDRQLRRPRAAFQRFAARAVERIAPDFDPTGGAEYRDTDQRCATHRYAGFSRGVEEIVVAAWRVISAADPFWVANEAPFVRVDDSTLVSRGEHILVMLLVAPDGTTARVSAYGERARAMTAGWPTTMPQAPSAPEPGTTALTPDELIPIARSVLAFVLDQR